MFGERNGTRSAGGRRGVRKGRSGMSGVELGDLINDVGGGGVGLRRELVG